MAGVQMLTRVGRGTRLGQSKLQIPLNHSKYFIFPNIVNLHFCAVETRKRCSLILLELNWGEHMERHTASFFPPPAI